MSDHASPSQKQSRSRVADLILAHARDYAIFGLDRQGVIGSWGPGAERVTGYSEGEAVGSNFSMLFTLSDQAADQPAVELEKAWRDGTAEDTRWHVTKAGVRFWANGVTTAFDDAGAQGLIKIMRDETRSRLAEEQRVLLLNELNHRVNNTLVTVQSLVEQTLRGAGVDPTVRSDLAARLMALADAHKLLVAQNWAGAELTAIVRQAVAPYDSLAKSRLQIDGPQVRLSPQQAVSLSLVIHELTTNAVKYGALSVDGGLVLVAWNPHQDEDGTRYVTFLWEEIGGPPVATPTRKGFGTRLLSRSFGPEAPGDVKVEFATAGVRCTINLQLSGPAEILNPNPRNEEFDA